MFEEFWMTSFNVFFTGLPPLIYAAFERDLNDNKIETFPQSYIESKNGIYWGWTVLNTTIASILWHSGGTSTF
jgi:hypothetical protein